MRGHHRPNTRHTKILNSRTALAISLLLAPLGACECQGDLEVIAPALYVDVCTTPAVTRDGEFLGGFEECAVDFGPTDISVRVTREILLSNPTNIELAGPDVEGSAETRPIEIFFTENSDPAFRVEAAPDFIADGLIKVPLVISYRPTLESAQSATLVIRTNAANIPEGQDVIIEVTGEGVDNGIPNIVVSPTACEFGRVASGSVDECTLQIENTGTRALVFDEVTFATDVDGEAYPKVPNGSVEPPFGFFGRPPAADEVLPAPPEANAQSIKVRFSPDQLGSFAGFLAIRTNDPDSPEILVPLDGISVDPPTCEVKLESVNGIPVMADVAPTIEPLDDVIVTATDSIPSTASGAITAFEWTIVDKPVGSTVTLTNPGGASTGLTFADVLGVDLAGRYRIRAKVTDDLGTESVNSCDIEFEAIPTDSLLAQLSWDTAEGDMDLHVTLRNNLGQFCPQGVDLAAGSISGDCSSTPPPDCYYANCKADSGSRPDWDGDGTNGTEGDPSLDIDDLSGFGPENINIDTAIPGEYLVGVDYFSFSGGAVGNTIRIYLYGQLQAEFFRELQSGDFWEVGVIHWPQACIEDLSTPAAECM